MVWPLTGFWETTCKPLEYLTSQPGTNQAQPYLASKIRRDRHVQGGMAVDWNILLNKSIFAYHRVLDHARHSMLAVRFRVGASGHVVSGWGSGTETQPCLRDQPPVKPWTLRFRWISLLATPCMLPHTLAGRNKCHRMTLLGEDSWMLPTWSLLNPALCASSLCWFSLVSFHCNKLHRV